MYNTFATIYDSFMDNVPYEIWCDQTVDILNKYGIFSGIIAELGCGTGTFTEMLAKRGFDMIGIDLSAEMLDEAMNKKYESGLDILYLNQDMREFELYGTCAAIVSRCDSMNYLTDYEDIVKCFKLVNNYLDPKGLFVFDMKTEFMYSQILGNNTFSRSTDEATYIWQNAYIPEEKINEYLLTMFIEDGKGKFEKSVEVHDQKAYSLDEIKKAAEEAGLLFVDALDADDEGEIVDETARMLVVLQEHGKAQ